MEEEAAANQGQRRSEGALSGAALAENQLRIPAEAREGLSFVAIDRRWRVFRD